MQDSYLTRVRPEEPAFKNEDVAVVGRKWFEEEHAPLKAAAPPETKEGGTELSAWKLGSKEVVSKNLSHEYALTLLKATIHPSTDVKVLLAKCRILVYFLLPHAKLLTTTVFWLTEEGVRQLLAYHLAVLFYHLAVKSERKGSTGKAMLGMLAWSYEHFLALQEVKAPFPDIPKYQNSAFALLLLYVDDENDTRRVGLRLAAMKRFLDLRDKERYKTAEAKVPPHTTIDPCTEFAMPELVGPSSLENSLAFEPLSELCLQLVSPSKAGTSSQPPPSKDIS